MGDIKSAREIAMEKIDKLGEPTEEERLEWKYLPEGEKLAARYLKQEADLPSELKKFDKKAASYVIEGISAVLIKNMLLPENESAKKLGKRAMDGIKAIKTDKSHVEAALNQIRHVFDHYEQQGAQQRKQAYEALKVDFQGKVEQALRQQMGGSTAGMRIDIEKQPQFQEEWRKVKAQLDAQYMQVLNQYKQELEALN
jgi:plasmid stabilization system protein ParE